jgi:hypothetical protein
MTIFDSYGCFENGLQRCGLISRLESKKTFEKCNAK